MCSTGLTSRFMVKYGLRFNSGLNVFHGPIQGKGRASFLTHQFAPRKPIWLSGFRPIHAMSYGRQSELKCSFYWLVQGWIQLGSSNDHLYIEACIELYYSLRSLLVYPFLLYKVLEETMLWDIKGKRNYYFMLKLNVCVS